jgi:hypothetical protein
MVAVSSSAMYGVRCRYLFVLVYVRTNTGEPAVAVTIPREYSITLTNIFMSNGSIGYFGSDINMYGNTIPESDAVQVYDLTLAGNLSVIAVKGALAMLEDGSVMTLTYYNQSWEYRENGSSYEVIDRRPHPYTELGIGYTCPSTLTVTASDSNGLANAIARLEVHSQYRYIELGAGTHHITQTLVLLAGADVIIRAQQNAVVMIDCSAVNGPCFSFTDNYSVTLQGLRIQTSSRRLATSDSGTDQHRELVASNEGLYFKNVRVISLSDVVLQGFNGNSGSALHVECSTARSCSNVNVARVDFVDNTAVQNGGAVMLDISVPGTVFNFDTVAFNGNTAQTGAALYWYVRLYLIYSFTS